MRIPVKCDCLQLDEHYFYLILHGTTWSLSFLDTQIQWLQYKCCISKKEFKLNILKNICTVFSAIILSKKPIMSGFFFFSKLHFVNHFIKISEVIRTLVFSWYSINQLSNFKPLKLRGFKFLQIITNFLLYVHTTWNDYTIHCFFGRDSNTLL